MRNFILLTREWRLSERGLMRKFTLFMRKSYGNFTLFNLTICQKQRYNIAEDESKLNDVGSGKTIAKHSQNYASTNIERFSKWTVRKENGNLLNGRNAQ